jgi:hypothetical protein
LDDASSCCEAQGFSSGGWDCVWLPPRRRFAHVSPQHDDREFIDVVGGRGCKMILDDPEEQFRYRSELDKYLVNRLDRVKFELGQTGWTDATYGPLREELLGRIVTLEDRQTCIGPEGRVVGIRYVLNEMDDSASKPWDPVYGDRGRDGSMCQRSRCRDRATHPPGAGESTGGPRLCGRLERCRGRHAILVSKMTLIAVCRDLTMRVVQGR